MKSKPKMQTILKGGDDLDEYSSTIFGLKIMISRRTSRDVQEQYGEVNKFLILLILLTAISNERIFFCSKASLTESSASLVKLLGSITTDCNSLLRKTMLSLLNLAVHTKNRKKYF